MRVCNQPFVGAGNRAHFWPEPPYQATLATMKNMRRVVSAVPFLFAVTCITLNRRGMEYPP